MLGGGETLGSDSRPAGVLDQAAGGEAAVADRGEHVDSHIDTSGSTGGFEGLGGHVVAGEHEHPFAALSSHPDRLERALHGPVRGHFYITDTLEVHPARLGFPPAAVAVFGPLHTVEAASGLEAGIAGLGAAAHPREERPERLVQSAQGGLLGRERPPGHFRSGCPDVAQLGGLGAVTNRCLGPGRAEEPIRAADHPFVGFAAFLEGGVVDLPVVVEACLEAQVLSFGRAQPELIGPSHAGVPHWCSMYCPTVRSDTYPALVAKYDLDHRTFLRPSQANPVVSARDVHSARTGELAAPPANRSGAT